MPFNRDLIETGCVLKTFDGDLTLLERAVDFTVKKSSSFSPTKDETAVFAPVSTNFSTEATSLPKERRHIKDVVYGDKSDEMPSTATQEVHTESQQDVKVPDVSNHVSKQMVEVPAVSGFCFRHNIEETQTITNTVQTVCNTPSIQPTVAAVRPANTSRDLCRATRVSRSVKDVVYGDFDLDGHAGQSTQIKTESKPEQPQTPVTHFKSCMREEVAADSAPHTRIAMKPLMSEVTHHTHWRSAIHGF
jgi:hypothetical protein